MKSISSIITKCARACVWSLCLENFIVFFHFSIFAQRPSYFVQHKSWSTWFKSSTVGHSQPFYANKHNCPVYCTTWYRLESFNSSFDGDIVVAADSIFQVGSHKEMIPTIWAKQKRTIDVALNYILLKQTFIEAKRSDLLTVFECEPRARIFFTAIQTCRL